MDMNMLMNLQKQTQIARVIATNEKTERFGLALTKADAELIVAERMNTLKEERRVEFGRSISERIIEVFCDSPYITQADYVETIVRLQEIFFLYKNEMMDEITDEELLSFMRKQFDEVCFGDLEYLEGYCLEAFAEAIRLGYEGYIGNESGDYFSQLDGNVRWDVRLYMAALANLF